MRLVLIKKMKVFRSIGNILRFSLGLILIPVFLFTFSSQAFPQDSGYFGSHEDGKKLLEEKKYSEAEKLALSLLTNNPSDPNAEYLLSSAWVGLGREEANKGNLDKAISLLQKARQKWPFDQELKKEIELLGNISSRKNIQSNSSQNRKSAGSQTVVLLDSELFRSIEDIKEELNTILLQTKSFREGNEPFSSKETFYQISIVVLAFFSVLNFIFTFLLWRKK